MIQVEVSDTVYVDRSAVITESPQDIIDIMDFNAISPVEILEELKWELPDFQEAARQLDLEYLPMATTGERLYLLFRKLSPTEQREFMANMADALVLYYGAMPVNELS